MKKISSFLLLAVPLCAAAVYAATAPRVSANVLKLIETSLDDRIRSFWPENPFPIVRLTRGLYLDGYGAVFTVDVSPVLSTTSMMHTTVTKDEVVKAHKARAERIAQLKQVMPMAVADIAAALETVPPDDQVTLVVYLAYHDWEDVSGTPGQLTFRGKKRALLDAKRAGGAALAQAVLVSEN
ncbi:MAG TPA: hypothetical protein VK752_11315 [Bryobacteraceae bacterium]|jgi:hypothetical protein|nr:hypothetical protein [Bryobacteraceae bacterium]